ncbi:Polygalacturonase [Balamuthia mandrillaris]
MFYRQRRPPGYPLYSWWVLCLLCLLLLLQGPLVVLARVLDIVDFGAVADSKEAAARNTAAISSAFANATNGDTVLLPEGNFFVLGGIQGSSLTNVTLQMEGVLTALPDIEAWPHAKRAYLPLIQLSNCSFLTVTSLSGQANIDGQGAIWWDKTILNQLAYTRPKLFVITESTDLLLERFNMTNAPFWHLVLEHNARVEVRYVNVMVERSIQQMFKDRMRQLRGGRALQGASSMGLEPEDLNTDGIDPSGTDYWIHDCFIMNDDDSVAVKPSNGRSPLSSCSQNMVIENMVMTGFGASIGSVPPHEHVNCIRNITFRNISMPQTGKGIYIKSNPTCSDPGDRPQKRGIIQDILYEDVHILQPRWWSIWIGPQQQHQPGSKLDRKCALAYPLSPHCPTQGCVDFHNITLRRVTIQDPWLSPGVILGNSTNPMQGLVFDGVVVRGGPGWFPFGGEYHCEHVFGKAINSQPVPSCLSSSPSSSYLSSALGIR